MAVRSRAGAAAWGEQVKQSYLEEAGVPWSGSANQHLFIAVRIADRFRDQIPSKEALISEFGMNRATAYRWIRAIKDARGLQ